VGSVIFYDKIEDMKITKLGHCCLIIETNGKRVMTDPGSYTAEEQIKEKNVDLVLITHEHPDHFHIESLKKIIANNPNVQIITNDKVGHFLKDAGIEFRVLKNKSPEDILGVEIEAHDCQHEEIFQEFSIVQNMGFFIGKRLFYPGDSFYNPGKKVEILALPVAGPWARIKDAINYAISVKPEICFPVHDGGLKSPGSSHRVPEFALPVFNIVFKNFEEKNEEEF
jgi:L-ascorbate metabolism protein UlaG (beta-lactamase superfamily)